MSRPPPKRPTIELDGWMLVSAEERHAANPKTFQIPSREARTALSPGDAAQLLFDIETKEGGRVIDRGVDRLWVIVKARVDGGYLGILDSDPGAAEGILLRPGVELSFGPEHIAAIQLTSC
jgi:hypothetical protein